ncbi:hypothetical protein L596_015461 [Steinernema carpocapsae]|uniref:Uncharacterized protein n=1 Tax=Steinernema carpocapsae TaxID=34508 RepID=A0A4U5NF82_STECR|nr:hypothetical protein L596_015461 [Steinernema carpocapsae]
MCTSLFYLISSKIGTSIMIYRPVLHIFCFTCNVHPFLKKEPQSRFRTVEYAIYSSDAKFKPASLLNFLLFCIKKLELK